ncbi:glucose dehydrogenase [FAD, quinone]-like [Bactrocera neohumeralis]|uniref:glucose dehydrogenase [FAD, quinone]-like n=1 Tax=Bactrocera tryoni TaxID=59916 RepID=UPI001A98C05C|nr:glucose dehydrogenase [FAD, quinone]-like [Bactrocera tryoni]XP_050330168.1 glucose dehydrogenase [FAD, quinone]-like [Bactrocera neohumeralis]
MWTRLVLIVLLLTTFSRVSHAQRGNIITTLFEFLRRGQNDLNIEHVDDNVQLLNEYDFIVVGAGTAGCTLAARLAENPAWKVLLIEAGGPENMAMDIPILAHFLQLTEINWGYRTQPSDKYCLAMNNRRCNWPRGKVMGGSSVLNYMMYTRGNRRDYDRWAALGNEGWSYREVLPYFRKYEGSEIPNAERDYVGRQGPVKIGYPGWRSQISAAFVQAAQEDGLKYRDYNGRIQTGVSYLQATIHNGMRWSSNRAYLYPHKGKRSNLHVKKNTLVTKVLIEPRTKTAYGVILSTGGQSYQVRARREVILSAGAINTPQLLMLSGIGPAKHLRDVGIKPIADLAVGYNLQDHIAPAVSFTANVSSIRTTDYFETSNIMKYIDGKGVFGLPGAVEAIAFWDLGQPWLEDGWPDLEMFQLAGSFDENPATLRAFGLQPDIYNTMFGNVKSDGFMIFPMILRPKSRGRVLLKSNDPFKYPLLYANYFAHPDDLDIAVRGVLKTISLIEKPAFKAINARMLERVMPGCAKVPYKSRAYWECYVRHFTFTIYHYSGTAKMGPVTDPTAVVDPRLRVYGVNQLRVVDASIMPEIIAGHPNGPVFMIAEKAADMIKQDYNYI